MLTPPSSCSGSYNCLTSTCTHPFTCICKLSYRFHFITNFLPAPQPTIFPSHFLQANFLGNYAVTLFTPTHLPYSRCGFAYCTDKQKAWIRILASVRLFICCVLSSPLPSRSVGRSNFYRGLHNLIMLIQKDKKIKIKLSYMQDGSKVGLLLLHYLFHINSHVLDINYRE